MNDISIDSVGLPPMPKKMEPDHKNPVKPEAPTTSITVSNQLEKWVGMMSTSASATTEDNSRVNELRAQILSNQYSIDFNRLSQKILASGILNSSEG